MDLAGGGRGGEDVMQGRADAEDQDGLAGGGLAQRLDKEGDGMPLVGLDRAVVVVEVGARAPVGLEAGEAWPAVQERADGAAEGELVGGGAEVAPARKASASPAETSVRSAAPATPR